MNATHQYSDQPKAGYYQLRLVREGPLVAASIGPRCPMIPADAYLFDYDEWCRPLDRARHNDLIGWVDGKGFEDPWKFYSRCKPIAQVDFLYMVAHSQWARTHAPDLPTANPGQPIDLFTSKPAF